MTNFSEEDLKIIMTLAYYKGVEDGEAGIPADYDSHNPKHLTWYADTYIKMKDEIMTDISEKLKMLKK
jgi:hypothetical protein